MAVVCYLVFVCTCGVHHVLCMCECVCVVECVVVCVVMCVDMCVHTGRQPHTQPNNHTCGLGHCVIVFLYLYVFVVVSVSVCVCVVWRVCLWICVCGMGPGVCCMCVWRENYIKCVLYLKLCMAACILYFVPEFSHFWYSVSFPENSLDLFWYKTEEHTLFVLHCTCRHTTHTIHVQTHANTVRLHSKVTYIVKPTHAHKLSTPSFVVTNVVEDMVGTATNPIVLISGTCAAR